MSVLDLVKVWPLVRGLEGSRLQKVAHSGSVFHFKFRDGGIVFSTRRGLVPAGADARLPAELGKARWSSRLEGRRLESVSQVAGDRVVCLDLGGEKVVLEWVREGNLVLLGRQGEVVHALAPKEMRDRSLKPGETYKPPPKLGDVFSDDPEKLYEAFRAMARRSAIVALSLATSLPPDLVAEAMYREGLSLDSKAGALTFREFRSVAARGVEIFIEAVGEASKGYRAGGRVYSFKPTHRASTFVEVDFLEAFPGEMLRLIARDLAPPPQRSKPAILEEVLEDYARKVRLLEEHAAEVEDVIQSYRALMGERKPWSLVEEELRERYPAVRRVDPSRPSILLEIEGVEVEVDPSRSAYANIESLYGKIKSVRGRLAEARSREATAAERPAERAPQAPKPWYAQFRYFRTSSGFLVVAGRSAGQNQLLVRRYLDEADIFLHADIHGAAAVVLKTGGGQVSERDILEAAQFAACYSSAWRAGLYAVDVYWVHADQVSLRAPSGEYLAKGSFMIYGKKNYVRGVKLELLVGVTSSGELAALPAEQSPAAGCFLKVTPGPYRKDLAARKICEHLRRECGFRVREEDVARLLPEGGFHLERWRPWTQGT